MKRRKIAFVAVTLLVVVLALPLKNLYAASQRNPSLFTEFSVGPQEVQVIGQGATYLSEKLQEYSDANELNFVVSGPYEANSAKTKLVVLETFDFISELPEHLQVCNDRCTEETFASSTTAIGILSRDWKIAYIQMMPFAVDGTVDGERFNCLMRIMAAEAAVISPNHIKDSSDCIALLSGGEVSYKAHVSFPLIDFKFGI